MNTVSCTCVYRKKIVAEKGLASIEHYMTEDHEMLRRAGTECMCNMVMNEQVSLCNVVHSYCTQLSFCCHSVFTVKHCSKNLIPDQNLLSLKPSFWKLYFYINLQIFQENLKNFNAVGIQSNTHTCSLA